MSWIWLEFFEEAKGSQVMDTVSWHQQTRQSGKISIIFTLKGNVTTLSSSHREVLRVLLLISPRPLVIVLKRPKWITKATISLLKAPHLSPLGGCMDNTSAPLGVSLRQLRDNFETTLGQLWENLETAFRRLWYNPVGGIWSFFPGVSPNYLKLSNLQFWLVF